MFQQLKLWALCPKSAPEWFRAELKEHRDTLGRLRLTLASALWGGAVAAAAVGAGSSVQSVLGLELQLPQGYACASAATEVHFVFRPLRLWYGRSDFASLHFFLKTFAAPKHWHFSGGGVWLQKHLLETPLSDLPRIFYESPRSGRRTRTEPRAGRVRAGNLEGVGSIGRFFQWTFGVGVSEAF